MKWDIFKRKVGNTCGSGFVSTFFLWKSIWKLQRQRSSKRHLDLCGKYCNSVTFSWLAENNVFVLLLNSEKNPLSFLNLTFVVLLRFCISNQPRKLTKPLNLVIQFYPYPFPLSLFLLEEDQTTKIKTAAKKGEKKEKKRHQNFFHILSSSIRPRGA